MHIIVVNSAVLDGNDPFLEKDITLNRKPFKTQSKHDIFKF